MFKSIPQIDLLENNQLPRFNVKKGTINEIPLMIPLPKIVH
jgi:hypothetical protein